MPNQTARLNTTPTTAALMADSAELRSRMPRSCSICGARVWGFLKLAYFFRVISHRFEA
jgi:hypothetical protein